MHPKVVGFIVFAGSSFPISLVAPPLASAPVISSPSLETQAGALSAKRRRAQKGGTWHAVVVNAWKRTWQRTRN